MKPLAFALLAILATPGLAQQSPSPVPAPLTIEQQTLLRCSATFALVAAEQARGEAFALGYPPLAERGREYFVRTAARLTDELGLDRAAVSALMSREAARIQHERAQADDAAEITDRIMRTCLVSLTASGL